MPYIVVKVDTKDVGKAKRILTDDLLSRQSYTIREGGSLGLDGDFSVVLLEGSEDAMDRAIDMFKSEEIGNLLEADEKEKIYNLIKEEEENSMVGMGAIFG